MLHPSVRLQVVISLLLVMLLTGLATGPAIAATSIRNVTISDVRDLYFTVSWTTDAVSDGTVTWSTSKPISTGTPVSDVVSSTTHYVEVSGLSPNTTYYFQVSSGGVTDNNSGTYYQVTTGLSPTPPPISNVIYGIVYQSNGTTPVPNAIVYLQLQDADGAGSAGSSQLVSARADEFGNWFYVLSNIRASDSKTYFSFTIVTDNLRLSGQGGWQGTRGFDPNPWIIPIPTIDPFHQDVILSQNPTAVNMVSFTGEALFGRLQLDWMTANESTLLGFNVYRASTAGGVKEKLNSNLIPAQTPGSMTGNSYQFQDGTAVSGKTYDYSIEMVMMGGNQNYGPVSIQTPFWTWLPMTRH